MPLVLSCNVTDYSRASSSMICSPPSLLGFRQAPSPHPLSGPPDHLPCHHVSKVLIHVYLTNSLLPNLGVLLRAELERHDLINTAMQGQNLLADVRSLLAWCVEPRQRIFWHVAIVASQQAIPQGIRGHRADRYADADSWVVAK